nr:MAG TPA: hypothetical protein [Caudoviricetes sp.]
MLIIVVLENLFKKFSRRKIYHPRGRSGDNSNFGNRYLS